MTGSLLRKDAVDLDLVWTIWQVRFNPIQYGSIDSGGLQLGEQEPMVALSQRRRDLQPGWGLMIASQKVFLYMFTIKNVYFYTYTIDYYLHPT